jgi:hypothetical protein
MNGPARYSSLEVAIKALYRVFARYKIREPITGCSHCSNDEDDARLRSKPLRQLDGNDLERFAFKAMTTLGTVDDFKHFLPRLFQIAAEEGDVGGTDFEIVLGKLDYGKWRKWRPEEQDALEEFFGALWHHLLNDVNSPVTANSFLSAMSQVADSIDAYLTDWHQHNALPAVCRLIEFIDWHADSVLRNKDAFGIFWNQNRRAAREALEWLVSEKTANYLESSYFRFSDEPSAAQISFAAEQLLAMRRFVEPIKTSK